MLLSFEKKKYFCSQMVRKVIVFFLLAVLFSYRSSAQQRPMTELFCGATFDYADTNWLRLYDIQVYATPGLRLNLQHNWSFAFQGMIPVVSDGYTFRDRVNKYWRIGMVSVSHQLHFNDAGQHLKLSAGLFGSSRYGADIKWMWPINSWLLLMAQAGLTSSWLVGSDLNGHSNAEMKSDFVFSGQAGASTYLRPWNIEMRLSGGRYVAGDYGSQFDVMRHFHHCTLLAFAQLRFGKKFANLYDDKHYSTNGGFKIIMMLPPYTKSRKSYVVRPASNFRLTYDARADGLPMNTYRTDPEENERELQVDVDWGLRKEGDQ